MAETFLSPGVFTRENDLSIIQPTPLAVSAAFIGPTVKGSVMDPTVITSYNQFVNRFGETFISGTDSHEFLTSMAVRSFFNQGGLTALVVRIDDGTFSSASNTNIQSSGSIGQPFELETIGKGQIFNNSTGSTDPGLEFANGALQSGSADNVRWEIVNVDESRGTFTLLIRRGDDETRRKVVLETFTNVSLDPKSDNYIERVVGTQQRVYDSVENYVKVLGEFPNRSNYLRVKQVNLKTPDYLDNQGDPKPAFTGSLPVEGSGSFFGATGSVAKANASYYNGFSSNIQGFLPSDYTDAIELLGNSDEYQINMICAPGLIAEHHNSQVNLLVNLAETRGDCIAVVDMVDYNSTVKDATDQSGNFNSSYAATYWPFVQLRSATGKNQYVPASTVMPGVFAFNDIISAPWFAPAGLTRGGIPEVVQVERKVTKADRDALYSKNINPIATFPGTGIAVFGQKTLQKRLSALDRVNVRRLLIELKRFFSEQARNLVFEQNTITTRNRFLAAVNPFLENITQRQGLTAFRVVMDESNNTADVIDRNQLVGQVFIQPSRTAEFIVLDFTVEPTGASFDV